jgi:hypothetical protein
VAPDNNATLASEPLDILGRPRVVENFLVLSGASKMQALGQVFTFDIWESYDPVVFLQIMAGA